jgi:hypothetical protein
MTAAGKINASKVQAGDRIIVRDTRDGVDGKPGITCSHTKTGEGRRVARVIGKTQVNADNYGRRTQRWYRIETTEGSFDAAPIQTMFLAPDDAAGIKRAYVEALAEDAERTQAAELSSGNAAVDAWCEENDAEAERERLERAASQARLEARVAPQKPDTYWTEGPGVQVLQRDAELAAGASERPLAEELSAQDKANAWAGAQTDRLVREHAEDLENAWRVTDAGRNALQAEPLPQREPGRALVEELLGQDVDKAMGLPEASEADAAAVVARHARPIRPGYRAQTLLQRLDSEVLERASRETYVAVGAEWGRLEGLRVRIGCMDGDVFHQRPLMIVEAGDRELDWTKTGTQTVDMPVALHVGSMVLVDSSRVYTVDVSPLAGETPRLYPVK